MQFGCDVVEMVAAMPAANVTAVWDVLFDELQGFGVITNHPLDAEIADPLAERFNRSFEFPLLYRDGDQFKRERRALLVSHQRVKKRETVLAAIHSNRNAVVRA